MTRIARKSDRPATSCAAKSSPNVSLYWARALIEAPARRRYVVSGAHRSATLNHQPPNGRCQQEAPSPQKAHGPPRLEGNGSEEVEALTLPEENVDWDLKDASEWQSLEHGARALRQEVERDDEAREERPRHGGHVQDSAVVEQPEGAQVDDEAETEAEDRGQHEGGDEHEPPSRVDRDPQREQEATYYERRYAAKDGVEQRSTEVAGEPVALEVDRPAQVDGDVAAHDAQSELVPAPEIGDHDHALRQPDIGE